MEHKYYSKTGYSFLNGNPIKDGRNADNVITFCL